MPRVSRAGIVDGIAEELVGDEWDVERVVLEVKNRTCQRNVKVPPDLRDQIQVI